MPLSVCVLTRGSGPEPNKEIWRFGSTTAGLRVLTAWLRQCGAMHAVMESTGVCWRPVYNILGSACELILVNARHIKQAPGHKTDKADCARIASLLRHGPLQASFVPQREARQLRNLCRIRTTLVRECMRVGNRIRKVLEDANIKLDSAASDSLGVSSRSMIMALIQSCQDPLELGRLAQRGLRAKLAELEEALAGEVIQHH